MPLKAGLKKKTVQEKEQSYTKATNNVSLPKKNSVSTTAKTAAQTIKRDTIQKSSVSSSGYVRQSPKLNKVKREQERKKWDMEKGSYKTDSKNNVGRTGSNTHKKSVSQWVSELNESTGGKKYPYEGISQDKVFSHKQGGHQNQQNIEKSNKNLRNNERHQAYTDPYFVSIAGEEASNNAIPKFFGNLSEAAINYSPVGLPATVLSGSTPSEWDFFKPHNYTKEDEYRNNRFHSGLSAMGGQLVGGAIGFNAGRGLGYMKAYEGFADDIINGTKLGNAIKNSSMAGKIGTKLGTQAADDIIRNGVAEGLRDITMGVGENAVISYGEGNRGMDWLKDTAMQTGANLALGYGFSSAGTGLKLRGVNKLLNTNPADLLRKSNSKSSYMNKLLAEAEENLRRLDIEGLSKEVRDAHLNKAAELMNELENVRNMDDTLFKEYRGSGEMPDVSNLGNAVSDSVGDTVGEATGNVPQNKNLKRGKTATVRNAETKAEYENRKAVEEQIRQENPDEYRATRRNLKRTPEETTITVGDSVQTKATPEAEATVKETAQPKVKEQPVAEKPVEVKTEPKQTKKAKAKKSSTKKTAEAKTETVEAKATEPTVKEPEVKETVEAKPEKPVETKVEEPTVKKETKPTEAKAEESKELPKKTDKPRAELRSRDGKETIIEKMRKAGVELPENPSKLTKEQLRSLNNGTLSLEDANKIKGRRTSVKRQINLDEYDKISIQRNKSENEIKDELIDRYIANKKELGEALSKSEIDNLKGMNPDDVRNVIDNDAVTRGGYKDLDEYYADTLYRGEEAKPELEHKHDSEAGSLKSEQPHKSNQDSYTKDAAKEIKLPKKVADDMSGFIERSIAMDIHPGLKPLSNRFSTDDLKITEDDVREFIENSDKFSLVDGKVHLKSAADPYATTVAGDGTATITSSVDIKGKGLPRRLEKGDRKLITQNRERIIREKIAKATASTDNTKKTLPKLKDKKYSAMDEPLSPEKAREAKKAKENGKQKFEKVSELNADTDIRPEATISHSAKEKKTLLNKTQETLRKARREVINRQQALERMDALTRGRKYQDIAQGYMNSRSRAMYNMDEELIDMNGETIGKAFNKIFDPVKNHIDEATEYMLYRHNIHRAKQSGNGLLSKDIWGFNKDSADSMSDMLVKSFPALDKSKAEVSKWLEGGMKEDKTYKALKKTYGKNFDNVVSSLQNYLSKNSEKRMKTIAEKFSKQYGIDIEKEVAKVFDDNWKKFRNEYFVNSGLLSKEAAKKFDSMYPNYFMTMRDIASVKGANSLDTPDIVKAIKGASQDGILSANEQIAIMVNRATRAAHENKLNLAIVKGIQNDPRLKEFGRVISVSDKLTDNLDDAISTVADAVDNVSKGARRLTALDNGKKVTVEISDELAKTLEAMYYGNGSTTIQRLGKTITNPIKRLTTTSNPLFIIPNFIRDTATYTVQSEHGLIKRTTGVARAMKGMVDSAMGLSTKESKLYKKYVANTGNIKELYAQNSDEFAGSILQNKSTKTALNKIQKVIGIFGEIGEKGETLYRFAEFLNTFEKTGDLNRAVRDGRKVTVDFAKSGSSDFVKTLDSWVLYLNAGLQGLDSAVQTMVKHPFRTSFRSATMIAAPFAALTAYNWDNPNYWGLTDRTRQQFFCIPNIFGEKDEDGNCKTFIKLPQSKEYGVLVGASLDSMFRAMRGDEDYMSGYTQSITEGVFPPNPVTDNILSPLFVNIPSNRDYKGDKILSTSEYDALKNGGKYLNKQYDQKTSNAAIGIADVANKIMGESDIPYLKYLKSPKLVDYLLDSYTGIAGSVAQAVTSPSNDTVADGGKALLSNKFIADARFSSGTMTKTFDTYDKYKVDMNNEETDANDWGEAHAIYYNGAKPVMDAIYDSIEKEKDIKADTSLSNSEKNDMIKDLREARVELAETLEDEVEKAKKEYKEAPTYSSLGESQREKWAASLGIGKEKWAIAYNEKLKANREKYEKTGKNLTQKEIIYILQEHGITTYAQAKSIDGSIGSTFYIDDEKGQKKWADAEEGIKGGKTFADVQKEVLEKYKRQENMTKAEKNFDNYSKARADIRYSETTRKVIDSKLYDAGLYELQYVDKNTDNNGSITQSEAINTIENLDQMYGLTDEQKAYFWHLFQPEKGWKKKPYGEWKG